jgi:hypothetical protein
MARRLRPWSAALVFTLGLVMSSVPALAIDYTWYRDADGDGFGDPGSPLQAPYPPAGYVEDYSDCNDADAAVNPGANEICDGIDNDCDLAVDEGCTTGVGDAARPLLALAPPTPNPSREQSLFRFTLPVESDATITIHDAGGRMLQRLVLGRLPAGPHERRWDGRDARGNRVASGIYFVRLEAGRGAITRRFVAIH